jgi:hypothetical protein
MSISKGVACANPVKCPFDQETDWTERTAARRKWRCRQPRFLRPSSSATDISARYAETAVIPRFTRAFYVQYQDRLLYGTDMGSSAAMYRTTFRILETEDEHFYDHSLFSYHWSLYGLGLPDAVLKKLYRDNAMRVLQQQAPVNQEDQSDP